MQPRILSSSSIIGTKVFNNLKENIGDIKDLMINLQDGRIDYAVLSFGGFLGMGDKLFAVPLEAFDVHPENETFQLNVSKEKLEQAPGFDKDNWPDTGDNSFRDSVYKHYGVERRAYVETTGQRTASLS